MKILFIVSDLFLGEPMGVLQLSACLKRYSYETKLLALKKHPLRKILKDYDPDVIAYSVMSPESELFKKADNSVRDWAKEYNKKKILRIMGGPHPTFFPEILEEMGLDAICIGEGDFAIIELINRFSSGKPLSNIPNTLSPGEHINKIDKELIHNLDDLRFVDRDIYYDAMPIYKSLGFRGFMVGRGCPYGCTYCHNHAYKKIFKDCGKIVRRRSVENVIREMRNVVNKYSQIKLMKISDDTFAHYVNDWLVEFIEKYKKEINLPFYCLMRSNTLTEEMAKLLSSAGCVSIGMSIESGNERIRNEILKRGLSDKLIINSFKYAKNNKIRTYGNTLLGIPGTSFTDDFESFLFTKKLKVTAPTFGIFNPYPKLQLTDYAIEKGYLDPAGVYDLKNVFGFRSPLNSFSDKEKEMQLNLSYLAPLFCDLPDFFIPLLRRLLQFKALSVYKFSGYVYHILKVALFIFPGAIPLNPFASLKIFKKAIKYFTPSVLTRTKLE